MNCSIIKGGQNQLEILCYPFLKTIMTFSNVFEFILIVIVSKLNTLQKRKTMGNLGIFLCRFHFYSEGNLESHLYEARKRANYR